MPVAIIVATFIVVVGIIGFIVVKQARLELCKKDATDNYYSFLEGEGREILCLNRGLSKDCKYSDLPLNVRNELLGLYDKGIEEAQSKCYKNFF